MKNKLSYFLNFPESFSKDLSEAIEKAINGGVNLQFVGLEGSGKSISFRSLLAKNDNYVYVNCNLLTEKSLEELVDKLNEFKNKQKRGVLLVDSFENDIGKMMSIYDQYRDWVTFVFSVEREVLMRSAYNVFYIKPLSGKNAEWFMESLIESGGVKVDDEKIKRIIEVSGGVMGIMKRILELVIDGRSLEDVVDNPGKHVKLAYQLELMMDGLGKDKNNQDLLKKYHLVDDGGKFVSRILENYVGHLRGGIKKDYLTNEEHKVMLCLEKNRGCVVSRDEVIREIWGENSTRDISDHALDQLIHRLRCKLKKDGLEIETVRGRGYIFN